MKVYFTFIPQVIIAVLVTFVERQLEKSLVTCGKSEICGNILASLTNPEGMGPREGPFDWCSYFTKKEENM